MTRRVLVLLTVWLVSGCGGSGVGPSEPIDLRTTLAIGQSVTADSAGLTLRFESVPTDSRCPADAMCVWAGVAVARLTVLSSERSIPVEIRSDPAVSRTAQADGLQVAWVQLDPYPMGGQPIQPESYRLTIHLTR